MNIARPTFVHWNPLRRQSIPARRWGRSAAQCWDSTGTNLTDADIPNVDEVSVQVSSTAAAITVDKLCLTKVEFRN
jgi:hypothetical protein